MNEINSQSKSDLGKIKPKWQSILFFGVLLIIISIIIYYVLKKDTVPTIPKDIKNNTLPKLNIKAASPALYLSSTKTDKLYMKDIDGKYWNAGRSSKCPFLALSQTTIPIEDIYGTYNCADLPEKLKVDTRCKLESGQDPSNQYISVLIKTADQYEKEIQDQIPPDRPIHIPEITTCYNKEYTSSNPGEGPLLSQIKNTSIEEHFKQYATPLAQMVSMIGVVDAVKTVLADFALGRMVSSLALPIAFITPALISGNVEAIKTSGIQSAFIFVQEFVDILLTELSMAAKPFAAKAGQSLISSTISNATSISTKATSSAMSTALQAGLSGLSNMFTLLDIVAIAAMALDLADPCNLNSGNMTQEIIDKYKEAYDKQMFIATKGLSYPNAWDAEKICDYKLMNSSIFWDNCMTDQQKSSLKKEEYIKEDQDKINNYVNEYIGKLTVNSQGQCIKEMSNLYLQNMLEKILPDIDWSDIGNLKEEDYDLPTDVISKKLTLIFANENTIAASYLYQYRYLIIGFFILIFLLFLFLN